jgi:hypothetical protein
MSVKGLDELNALLEERARYERWISQLMARREQTPQHVFERVRSDYASRLDAVMGQLRSHSQGLEASTAKLEQQVSTLAGEESTRQDARAEIELRAMVGEYTEERAQTELAAIDSELSRLERERSAAAAELSRVQEILSLVRQPARPAAPPPPAPAPASRPLGAPAAPPQPDPTVDELAFLNSVVEGANPLAPPAPSTPVSGVPRSEEIPLVTSLETSVRTEEEPPTRESLTLRQAAGTPAFLKGMPTEQVKTLKCQECGTMNYPTEWYCERCGGELAAM